MLFVFRLDRGNRIKPAGFLAMGCAFVAFGAVEFVQEGLTICFVTVAGTFSIVYLGIIFLPRYYAAWIPIPLGYLAFIWAVNYFQPLPRYDIRELLTFWVVVYVLAFLALSIVIWFLIRVLHFGSVRMRLLTIIISMALIPVILVVSLATYLGVQRSVQQSQVQLGSIADLNGRIYPPFWEVIAYITNLPADFVAIKSDYLSLGYTLLTGSLPHTKGHIEQITNAIAAARK